MRFQKVYVEITNMCNLACAFCPGTARPSGLMGEASFRKILQKLQGYTEYLYFHLMGEPLLHPQLATFLDAAHQAGFRVILTTNGTLLPQTQDMLLSAPALHKVNVSLHSFEANKNDHMETYLTACTEFAKAAAARGITVSLRLWNADGETAGLHARNPEILEHLHRAFPAPWEENSRGSKLSDHIYLNCAERFDWPSMSAQDRGDAVFCYGLKDQIGVLCDGTVVPCCLDSEGSIPLGNLLYQSLDEILASPRVAAMQEGFRHRCASEELCRRCGYARRF